ncbi:type IV pilin protein [Pseudomonas sp.]|uniref:type IV pilin protein n=1 Tax=Pseudomonas sp. TaxID=306 RepID=UPI002734F1EB|nr:type IV pilin protein [Pseudomonas sp.]MDP3813577.1 type IV pilin protein [Pseudomonas sp.]
MAQTRQDGFTLIELMIVVVIVAILAAIALPSYRSYVVRSNRAGAEGFMLEVANKQERFLLDNRQYAAPLSALGMSTPAEVSSNYAVTVTSSTVPGYTVTATPIGAQLADDTECGTLTLTQLGVKTASGGGARCWR